MVRLAQPADYPAIDRMLHDSKWSSHTSLLDRDTVIVTGPIGYPTGVLVARPAAFVHEVAVRPSLHQSGHAARLVQGAIRYTQGKAFPLLHAIFRVDLRNQPMLAFHRALGSVDEEGKMLSYTFPQV